MRRDPGAGARLELTLAARFLDVESCTATLGVILRSGLATEEIQCEELPLARMSSFVGAAEFR